MYLQPKNTFRYNHISAKLSHLFLDTGTIRKKTKK
jgi:hypothetical protein